MVSKKTMNYNKKSERKAASKKSQRKAASKKSQRNKNKSNKRQVILRHTDDPVKNNSFNEMPNNENLNNFSESEKQENNENNNNNNLK